MEDANSSITVYLQSEPGDIRATVLNELLDVGHVVHWLLCVANQINLLKYVFISTNGWGWGRGVKNLVLLVLSVTFHVTLTREKSGSEVNIIKGSRSLINV